MFYLLIIMIPGLLAAALTKSTFAKYSRIGAQRGLTGAEAAQAMLRRAGVSGCRIEPHRGFLSDHYDPRAKALRLSEGVFYGQSLSSIGVACHEAGHAIQDAENYGPLGLRSGLVPVTQVCGQTWIFLIMAGMLLHVPGLYMVGLLMLAVSVLFAIVTLPVEWDASRRAKLAMADAGFLVGEENRGAAKVLNAAFLTYLAAAVTPMFMLLYYALPLLGGGRSND